MLEYIIKDCHDEHYIYCMVIRPNGTVKRILYSRMCVPVTDSKTVAEFEEKYKKLL